MTETGKSKRQLALRTLIDKAGLQGYLTPDDLTEAFPNISQDTERLSLLLTTLRRRGIDILDPGVQSLTPVDRLRPSTSADCRQATRLTLNIILQD